MLSIPLGVSPVTTISPHENYCWLLCSANTGNKQRLEGTTYLYRFKSVNQS